MIAGGVATPAGFRAAGVSAGIKASGKPDLALIVSDRPATAAAVFTTNKAQAAPVLVSREHLTVSGGTARAIITNSGCANACTGEDGLLVARGMAAETAALIGCTADEVLVASTGVIGVNLSLDKVTAALPRAVAALGADQSSARRARRLHRRHGQGVRDDRTDDGDDARLPDDRCGRAAAVPAARVARGGGQHLQRHHRRR
jgi:glutamate N-acetyltransferase / amino-acid N-acetyltransferase